MKYECSQSDDVTDTRSVVSSHSPLDSSTVSQSSVAHSSVVCSPHSTVSRSPHSTVSHSPMAHSTACECGSQYGSGCGAIDRQWL